MKAIIHGNRCHLLVKVVTIILNQISLGAIKSIATFCAVQQKRTSVTNNNMQLTLDIFNNIEKSNHQIHQLHYFVASSVPFVSLIIIEYGQH